ncbi:MAG: sigma 54-interacting transcriptional regulator [Vicinamibacterales bacterium]
MPLLELLTLSQSLGSLEAGIWTDSGFSAVGLVVPVAREQVHFDVRTPNAVSINLVNLNDMPPALLAATPDGSLGTRLSPFGEALAADRMLAMWGLDAIHTVAVRTAAEAGLLFAALDGQRQFTEADAHYLRDLARRLEAVVAKGESDAAHAARLARVDAIAGVLPVLGAALDVREVFSHLSEIAARVIPHDSAVVGLLSDDFQQVHLHALSTPQGVVLPDTIDNPYPHGLNAGWVYVIHRDLTAHPVERTRRARNGEFRSSVRAAVWLDGKVAGVLDISSFKPDQYDDADAAVVVRLTEFVTLALSHERLAAAARRTEVERERAANLEMLDGLLDALSGALDIREVFHRVSEIARTVLAHDAMAVAMTVDDPPRLRIYALSGLDDLPESFETPMPEPFLLKDPWEYRMTNFAEDPRYSTSPTVKAGMRSVLCIPVRKDGRLQAGVNFYSRQPDGFTLDDVSVARRITDHIALAFSHQELAAEAQRAAEFRLATANLEMLDELLARAPALDELEEVLDRISSIAQKALPHDAMVVAVADAGSTRARLYGRASAGHQFPETLDNPGVASWPPGVDFELIDDLSSHPSRPHLDAASRGYQSALRVPVRFETLDTGTLVLLSLTPSSFTQADVLSAHRIADRLALALTRERRTAISARAVEATGRAAALEARVRALTEELDARTGARHVLGDSPIWKEVLGQATRVAGTDATVLLRGESGTGKEIVARFVHRASPRHHGPFIALNCAALPEHLLEAELFGYERGAFTDATQGKPGLLERAAGGTLFLDEVGELSGPAQAKFLRVLQEREFQRLGGTRVLQSDARIIAATNRDLEQLIALGRFRDDLYYRLNVFAIRLPLLRERRDDILPLTDALLAEITRGIGRPNAGVSAAARAKLWAYDWPGNVRELRNVLERAAILCEGGPITADHLALTVEPASAAPAPGPQPPPATDADEKTAIERALSDARFNKSKAAKALGLTRAQLYVRMHRHGLD